MKKESKEREGDARRALKRKEESEESSAKGVKAKSINVVEEMYNRDTCMFFWL